MAEILRSSNPFTAWRMEQESKHLKEERSHEISVPVVNSNQESVKQEDINRNDTSSTSPFDRIRHFDENGNEYWSARELQNLLGYTEWRNFSKAINKAKENFEAVGMAAEEQLVKVNKLSKRNNGAEVEVEDYRLTRRACYTVAVCCDANKPEVAAAKQYFVIRTRQAEVVQQAQQPADILDIMGMAVQTLKDIRDQQREQQKQLDQVTEEQKLISDRVNSLEAANKIEKPPAVISKRCSILNGLTTRLAQDNVMTYQRSKQMCYDHVLTVLGLDIDQELKKYKTACRRYYEHYKIYKGTPPKDVLRPAAIENLGWISYVGTNVEVYNNVKTLLESYLEED